MSEREKLEESIAELQDSIDDGMMFIAGPHTRRVVDAARKHLETLPKTVWRVIGLRPNNGGQARIVQTTKERALDSARVWLDQGYSSVTVEQVAP